MIDIKYVTNKRAVFFNIAKSYICDDSKVLDIGAGEGDFIEHCNRTDFFLYDGNSESVEKLKQKYPNCYQGKLPNLPFENNTFDLIHCSHVVEHLEPQAFYDSLKEMDKCLKKNGYLVISAPLMWENFYDDLSHVKPYNPNIFLKYLTKTNDTNLTRPKISESYKLVELKFRYREIFYTDFLTASERKMFARLILKIFSLFYRCGIHSYQKTGYTIVLQKS